MSGLGDEVVVGIDEFAQVDAGEEGEGGGRVGADDLDGAAEGGEVDLHAPALGTVVGLGFVLLGAGEFVAGAVGGGAEDGVGEEVGHARADALVHGVAAQALGERLARLEAVGATAGARGAALEPDPHLLGREARLADGRIEEDEGGEVVRLLGVEERAQRRDGVVNADRGLLPETLADGPENAAAVATERADAVRLLVADRVLAVVAKVVDEEVEAVG